MALTTAHTSGSATMEALDALQRIVIAQGATVVSSPRQVLIADWRTAGADELACHLAVTVCSA